MTGNGKKRPLSELNQLCLQFVRLAKGDTAVDYIGSVAEPTASDSVPKNLTQSLTGNRKPHASTRVPKKENKKNLTSDEIPKTPTTSWKKEMFEKLILNDGEHLAIQTLQSHLKCYNLLLRNMELEKTLGETFFKLFDFFFLIHFNTFII